MKINEKPCKSRALFLSEHIRTQKKFLKKANRHFVFKFIFNNKTRWSAEVSSIAFKFTKPFFVELNCFHILYLAGTLDRSRNAWNENETSQKINSFVNPDLEKRLETTF